MELTNLVSPLTLPPIGPFQSQRLIIRSLKNSDLDDIFEINSDDDVTRYLPYNTWHHQDAADSWLERMLELNDSKEGQQLVIEQAADKKVIGTILLFNYDVDQSQLEVGYVLRKLSWRKGIMKEALQMIIPDLLNELKISTLVAHVEQDNSASSKLLESIGFIYRGVIEEKSRVDESIVRLNCYSCDPKTYIK